MGEVSLNSASLLSSIASMYDNRLFSDVELIFTNENGVSGRIFCHSLILAIRSKKFAVMFFDDLDKKPFHKVELPSSKAPSFSHLVRFLYTDDLQLHTFEEAQELYDLATEYAVEELKEKCSNYILNEELKIDNLFSKYEYALSKGMHILLKECQNFVCSNSQLVLQSVDFTNASNDVVEDIVKLDNLSVSTELEVIGAILKWGSEELKRQNLSLDEKHLRKCIDPLKKHVRFLTLSHKEFDYLIDRYDIFSSKESSKLTQKMIIPLCDVVLPDSLSSIDVKRTGKVSSNSESSNSLHKNASSNLNKTIPTLNQFLNQNCSISESLIENGESNKIFNFSAKNTQSAISSNISSVMKITGKVSSNSEPSNSLHKNTSSNSNKTVPSLNQFLNQNCSISESVIENGESNKIFNFSAKNTQSASAISSNISSFDRSLKRSTSEDFSKSLSASIVSSQVSSKSLTVQEYLDSGVSDIPKLPASDVNKVSFKIKKISAFDETSERRPFVDEVKSSPNPMDTSYFARTILNGSVRPRDFEFFLQESLPCFRTSFQNDVKSSITFQMITGNLLLHGFEVKVKNESEKAVEELEIDVDLKGFSKQPFSQLYKEKLKDNVVFIKLPENMVLRAGNKGKLDVSIDNLLLNRSCTCNSSKPLELNCGNSFACEMTLNSTQKTETGGFLFLVSKLVYVSF